MDKRASTFDMGREVSVLVDYSVEAARRNMKDLTVSPRMKQFPTPTDQMKGVSRAARNLVMTPCEMMGAPTTEQIFADLETHHLRPVMLEEGLAFHAIQSWLAKKGPVLFFGSVFVVNRERCIPYVWGDDFGIELRIIEDTFRWQNLHRNIYVLTTKIER